MIHTIEVIVFWCLVLFLFIWALLVKTTKQQQQKTIKTNICLQENKNKTKSDIL